MDTYLARVCWNTRDWERPAGLCGSLEQGTFASRYGFGFEEWLRAFSWVIRDHHYGFLQPVGRSRVRLAGTTIRVLLYTVDDQKQRFYIGEINNCQVLTEFDAERALRKYKDAGWLADMTEQVRRAGGDVAAINPSGAAIDILNVRFRPEDFVYYENPFKAASTDRIVSLNRYQLALADGLVRDEWPNIRGSYDRPDPRMIHRKAVAATEYDPYHQRLQARAMEILQKRYGTPNVIREEGYVDIKLTKPDGVTYIEIKTAAQPHQAFREALGQLLGYAYYGCQPAAFPKRLAIVAPGIADSAFQEYLKRLRDLHELDIAYRTLHVNSEDLDL